MEILLDGNVITNKELLFMALHEQINNEEFYGNNLDALWDILSSINDDIVLKIINNDILKHNLGEYLDKLLSLFKKLNGSNRIVSIDIN